MILGSKLVAATGNWIRVEHDVNNQRAFILIPFQAPAPIFITRLGVFARRATGETGTPLIWLGIYRPNTVSVPTDLLGYTSRLPVTVAAGGGDVSGLISTPLGGTSVQLGAGEDFVLAVKVEGEAVEFASALVVVTQHLRTVGTINVPPTNPFEASSTVVDTAFTLYAEAEENDPPTVDLDAPLIGAVVNTVTPTFQGTFLDSNSDAPANDRMSAYAIEVRRQSDGVIMWGGPSALFIASQDEREDEAFERVYSGAALVANVNYEWRARVADDARVSSNWSSWSLFTVNALGQVSTADSSPNSKVDTASNLIDWQGRWWHPSGLSTNAVQVRVLLGAVGEGVLRTGTEVAQVVTNLDPLPGRLFTIQDTVAGIGTLQPGPYRFQIRGRASDGQWSPWSPERSFSINFPPSRPADLLPPSGAISSSRPLLEWLLDDPDNDDVVGVDVDSQIEITRPDLSVHLYSTLNYDSARGRGFLQLTSTHLPTTSANPYQWRVRGRDSSAGVLGEGAWSAPQALVFTSGPVVTITNPGVGEVEDTVVPSVAFNLDVGQLMTRYQVRMYRVNVVTPFKSSVQIPVSPPANAASFPIPVGWLVNTGVYDVDVVAWDAGNIAGVSARRRFSVLYTNPLVPNNFQVSGGLARFDHSQAPSTVLMSWDPSQYPPGEFAGYNIYRRLATQSTAKRILLRTLNSAGQTRWTDYWAPSNTLLVYGMSQLRRVGGQVLESPVVEGNVELTREVGILCSAYDAATLRFPLMWMESSLSGEKERPEASFVTWGSEGKPTAVTTPARYSKRTVAMTLEVFTDERGNLYDHVNAIEQLIDSGDPLAYIPERPEEQMWCRAKYRWQRGGVGKRRLSLQLEEIDFTPGSQGGT